ncbi:MAG: cytochrome C [Deltaproteobacteria bacterium HGW-Deltaproteobacteria-4]|nr:MAG: cytochrome C [Deltaproteobacteria bacterium HGW-Deltaproteobacteria-4]
MKLPLLLIPVLGLLFLAPFEVQADSCVTAQCHQSLRSLAYQHQPAVDGECLSCHARIAAEHPGTGSKSFKLVEKGAALCYQCHDVQNKKKVVHAPVAEGDCTTCHNPHGAANRFLLDVGEDQSGLCFDCHDNESFNRQSTHGPAAVGACTACHSPHQTDHKSLLKQPLRELCLDCHQDFSQQMKAAPVVHPPVQKGPCTDCHDPHSATAPFVLKKKMPDLCFECHANVGERLSKAKYKHKPIDQQGSCGSCHSTHFSKAKGLLPSGEKSLCLSCHGGDNRGTPPLKNIKTQLQDKKYLHGPLADGTCTPCHDPHGSDNFRMLTGPYPQGVYFPYQEGAYDFCLQCHDPKLLKFAETSIYTNFRDGNRNLHFVHVADNRKGRTCRLCHDHHASNGEKLISQGGFPFGGWNIPTRFQKTESGGSCASGCHRPLQYDRNAR